MYCRIAITGLIVLLQPAYAFSQTTVDLGADRNNTLYESETGNLSNGAGQSIFAGVTGPGGENSIRRALLRFPVADEIPPGSEIVSVTLRLRMTQSIAGTQTVALHRVSADWGEAASQAPRGEGEGGTAEDGDATWLHRFHPDEFWEAPGGDFEEEASASLDVGGVEFYAWESTDQLVDDVQGWLDDPETNFGWLIRGNESTNVTAKRFASRHNNAEDQRPVLTIEYLEQPTSIEDERPGRIQLLTAYPNPFSSTTRVTFSLESGAGVSLKLFDVLGREVKVLTEGYRLAGQHHVMLEGGGMASGTYYLQLHADGVRETRTVLLLGNR